MGSVFAVLNAAAVLHTIDFVFFLQVKWYRDTMLLDPNEFRLMEQFGIRKTLVLRKVRQQDFGNYSCSAENHLGKSRAFIEVSGKREQQQG